MYEIGPQIMIGISKNACNYVREFSYHTDKLGQIEYEKNISEE